jgi:hypothetical protein
MYIYFFVPESAKWLMTWRLYDVARESLAYVAKYNGNNEDKIDDKIRNVAFVKEFKEHELVNISGI